MLPTTCGLASRYGQLKRATTNRGRSRPNAPLQDLLGAAAATRRFQLQPKFLVTRNPLQCGMQRAAQLTSVPVRVLAQLQIG